jgi:ParB-like chromosome segregation protein Spo0J
MKLTTNKPRAVALDEINASPAVQIRLRLNQEAIATYAEILDQLPAVDLFNVKGHGLVLADGFHRVEAAKRADRSSIKAFIMEGTLNDAMEWAVISNLKHGQPLRGRERDDAIIRMLRLHPKWRRAQIAKAMGVSPSSVTNATELRRVRNTVQSKVTVRRTNDLRYVHPLPKKMWAPILEASNKRGWNSDELRIAVKNLKSDKTPESHKRALLEGRADPVLLVRGDEPAFLPESVARLLRQDAKSDANVILLKAEEALTRLAILPVDEVIAVLDRDHADRVIKEFPRFIKTLQTIDAEVRGLSTLREAK